MKIQSLIRNALTFLLLTHSVAAMATSGSSSGGSGGCSFSQPFNETWKAKYQDILKCYTKGMDPPLNWRPGGGTGTVEGSRGSSSSPTNITAWRAPEDPPNSGQSASNSAMNFSSGFPSYPTWSSGGSSGSSSGGGGNTITCPSTQTSGACSCSGVVTIAGFASHNCTASATSSSGSSGSSPGLCTCSPNTLTGTLTGTGTTNTGAGNVSGTLVGNLAAPNNVSGTFNGIITYASGAKHGISATFTGSMSESGTVSGTFSGTATAATTTSTGGETSGITGSIDGSVSSTSAPQDDDGGFCSIEGDRTSLSNQTLACGGAVPAPALQNRIINLMDNPYALGLVDANQYWFHYFEKNVPNKRYTLDKKYQIPTFLCRWEDVCDATGVCERKKVKDIDIPPPLPQTFSYSSALNTLYIKVKTLTSDPLTLEEEFTTRNKVIKVPIIGNKPYVPKDDENDDGDLEECDLTVDYYVDEPANTDFLSMVPFYEQNCDRGQFFLPGTCEPKILMFDKDNPTLIAPQESQISFYPVEGRNEVMVSNNKDGQLMIRYPSLIRLGGTGAYHFPDGVTAKFIGDPMLTQDNAYLWVSPPASLNANSTTVTLPNGGWIEDINGKTAEFSNGATTTVNWGSPLYAMPHGVMEFRGAMDYPTYRNSYVRQPIDVPAEEE